jgi:hypothetical protein
MKGCERLAKVIVMGMGLVGEEGEGEGGSPTSQIPYRKRDCRSPDRNGLFHKVNAYNTSPSALNQQQQRYCDKTTRTQRLDIILVPTPLDVLDHQRRLANLTVSQHTHFQNDTVGERHVSASTHQKENEISFHLFPSPF